MCAFSTVKEAESPNNSNYQDKCVVDDEEEESDNEHTYSNYSYSRLASHLTADEREQIFGLASIQPRNPVFVVVLQKSHVRGAKNILVSSIFLPWDENYYVVPCSFSLRQFGAFLPTNLREVSEYFSVFPMNILIC
jgi:hypothetical protein